MDLVPEPRTFTIGQLSDDVAALRDPREVTARTVTCDVSIAQLLVAKPVSLISDQEACDDF